MILSCYYLDEALNETELQFALQALTGPWAKFRTGAKTIAQRRVPAVLPVANEQGSYSGTREQRAERIRANLRHAGIRADAGHQVLWVMPQDIEWDAVFQYAIREETGFAPFVAQRWFVQEGEAVRGTLRIVDTQMLWSGL